MSKYLMTQSLLSSFGWMLKSDDPAAREDFVRTLRREPTEQTEPMCNGLEFERLVTLVVAGHDPPETHKWRNGILATADRLRGATFQVRLSCDLAVDDVTFLLYGVLDALKAGDVFDTKFSGTYHLNKYLSSPQTPMYFKLCPEAKRFTYLISDGEYLYREWYYPDEVRPIEWHIRGFMAYMHRSGLIGLYKEKWRAQE